MIVLPTFAAPASSWAKGPTVNPPDGCRVGHDNLRHRNACGNPGVGASDCP